MAQAAIDAYPEEACGILIGRDSGGVRTVERVVVTGNLADRNRGRRYEIDPQRVFESQRQAREEGLVVIGFFHSHPDGTTTPSARDAEAAWVDRSYPIVGVAGGSDGVRVTGFRSWRLVQAGQAMVEERFV